MFFPHSQFVDPSGACRMPNQYPYSYDPYYLWGGKQKDAETVYSDRLCQWDGDKYHKALVKATNHPRGNTKRLSGLNKKEASIFLSEYFDKKIEAVALAEGCNQSNGFPYWIFYYKTEK